MGALAIRWVFGGCSRGVRWLFEGWAQHAAPLQPVHLNHDFYIGDDDVPDEITPF
jgi:hypothetical protein